MSNIAFRIFKPILPPMLLRWFHALSDPSLPRLKYLGYAWLICFPPTLILGGLVNLLLPPPDVGYTSAQLPVSEPMQIAILFISVVIAAPLIETLFMVPMLALASMLSRDKTTVVCICAGMWAILHGAAWLPWGFVVFWPFCILSMVMLTYKDSKGWLEGIRMTTLLHMLHNLFAGVLIVVEQLTDK